MTHETRGHVGVAVLHPSHPENVGGIIRSAACFDADYVAVIGHQYSGEATAVGHDRHLPVWYFNFFRNLKISLPYDTDIVAVDYDAESQKLAEFAHPERALYVLGEEGDGFDRHRDVLERADSRVYIPTEYCLNVAVAGSMVLGDRYGGLR